MLFRPLLAEAASATLEPRHVVVPAADDVPARRARRRRRDRPRRGRAHRRGRVARRHASRCGTSGSCSRSARSRARCPFRASPSTPSASTTSPTRSRSATTCSPSSRPPTSRPTTPHLSFVFVGAGYAGVEALAELHDLVRDALRFYPQLRAAPQRWVLVEASDRILHELSPRLAAYVSKLLARRGIDVRTGTRLERLDAESATLSDGERIETHTRRVDDRRARAPAARGLGPPGRRARPGASRRAAAGRGP